jgi:uridine phosphorylase
MFNHNRGLWGYSGEAADGELLTIQSTGMGGPSAAIVVSELADMGARTLLRVGTCGGLVDELRLGQLVLATESITADGTSRALGGGERVADGTSRAVGSGQRVAGDPNLIEVLRTAASAAADDVAVGPVVSSDLFYDVPEGAEREWAAAGALAVEMETATLFALSANRGLVAGALLVVSDLVGSGPRARIEPDALARAVTEMGRLAAVGLAALPVGG